MWCRRSRSAYVTAKSAQIGMARSWARELAPLGITVNAVSPGFIPVERHADVHGGDKVGVRRERARRPLRNPGGASLTRSASSPLRGPAS